VNSPEQITDSVLTPEKEIVTTVGPAPLSSPPVENFSSVKTKKTNKKALIIFLIFLGVMIGIGAFWLGRFTKETGIGTIPSPTAVPTISQPTPTLDQTTGWKTYIDTKFGYSIKYPSEWLFNTETRSFREGDIFSVSIVGKDQKKDTEFYDGASLTIGEPIKTEKDIRTWVKEYYPVNNLDDEPNIFSEETIASLSFQKFFTCGLGCFTYYNIKHNGYVYRIVIFADGPDKIKYEQILSQILSTFKFLDQTSDQTSSWETYTNTKYGVEFKFPLGWILNTKPESEISKQGDDLRVIRNQINPFSPENKMVLLINIWDNPQKLSTVDWLKWREEEYQKRGFLPDYEKNSVFEVNAYVSGLPAFKEMREVEQVRKAGGRGGTALPLIDYYVAKNDKLFVIELNNYTLEAFSYKEETIYDLFDQIISTFKFLP